jgi:predicted PurR-regulated permease PerM
MGPNYSKIHAELKNSVIKIMYVADRNYEEVTVANHKDTILKILGVVNQLPNPTNHPIREIWKILTFIINRGTKASNDQTKLSSILRNVLTKEEILDIQNYFQTFEEYLSKHYPYVQSDAHKIRKLNAEIRTVREHCTTLYKKMIEKIKISVDLFWFFVTSMFLFSYEKKMN